MKTISIFLTVCGIAAAQSPQAPDLVRQSSDNAARVAAVAATPIYRVSVVARTTKAINYNHRSGSTKIDFRGTVLMPEARGEASVESEQGVIKIDARMEKLEPATRFGPEYLTYVMWAITPEGRATNVGEILLDGDKTKLDATTELQSFALIVTAEPYFAVTQPSDVVVMENIVRQDTVGTIEQVDAKYELLQRGQYTLNVDPADVKPLPATAKTPLELYEARNAVQIARWTGAERYAPETYQKAVEGLQNAEGYLTQRTTAKTIDTVAREAVQMAEDARIITIKKIEAEQLDNERRAGADREARAETARAEAQASAEAVADGAKQAQFEAQSKADQLKRDSDAKLETAQNDAMGARLDTAAAQANAEKVTEGAKQAQFEAQSKADQLKRENDAKIEIAQSAVDSANRDTLTQMAAARIEVEQAKGESDARTVAAQAEADRLKQENDVQRLAVKGEADRLKLENDAQRANSQAELDSAAKEKVDLRAQLLAQFSAVLQTRDTSRGLVVNMSGVLFDTAKFTLRPLAREKLAKVAGIVSGHPGLRLDVEGYTDSVGGDDYNQRLSEQRGEAVRDYLTQEGMAQSSVTAKGFGKAEPVASNDTAAGRQQNRRVEIVISGEIIGTEIGTPLAAK
jgi:outer membrane protein OmpA-like peptidoglycan-associated protein